MQGLLQGLDRIGTFSLGSLNHGQIVDPVENRRREAVRTAVGDFCPFQLAIRVQNHSQFPVSRGIPWTRHDGGVGVPNLCADRGLELLKGRLRQRRKIALPGWESVMRFGKE